VQIIAKRAAIDGARKTRIMSSKARHALAFRLECTSTEAWLGAPGSNKTRLPRC
jgi:hypothetical protein